MTPAVEPLAVERSRRQRLGLLLSLFAALLAPIALLADKAVVPLVIATALTGGVLIGAPALPWRILDRPVAWALGFFLTWCLIAAAWSFDPLDAATLALRIAVLLYLLLYLAALGRFLDDGQRRQVALGLCFGFTVAVLLVVIELGFGSPILTLLKGAINGESDTYSRLNRGVSALAILVWPLALLAWHLHWRYMAVILLLAVLVVTLFSESMASMVALAGGLVAAAVAGLGRSAARLVLTLAAVGALLGGPLIVEVLQEAGLQHNDSIPVNAQYRLHIWSVVSDRIAERPVFGWGFDASPALPTNDVEPFRPGKKIIPSHPHNGGLQIMVELGALGSLLAMGLLLVIGLRIDRLPPVPRLCAVGMSVSILLIACIAYGIWQSHWLAVIGAAAVMFATVLPRDDTPGVRRG